MLIREATVDDMPGIARVRSAAMIVPLTTPGGLLRRYESRPARLRSRYLVAEAGGEVAGVAQAGFSPFGTEPGRCAMVLAVHPGHTGQGIGSALLAAAEEHMRSIGGREVTAWAMAEAQGWASRRGYETTRPASVSMVDPRAVPAVPEPRPGVTLVSLAEAGPEAIHTIEATAVVDMPSVGPATTRPFAEWLPAVWDNPDLLHEVGVAALVDGVPAAYTLVEADLANARSWSGMTGTRPEYRGLGLAKLVKAEALHRAAAAGITAAYTGNDKENAPMLAVNRWLGYEPVAEQWVCVKEF
ncbi:GNAT family N-acetyltransferase [Longispora albida]|uniref:GNAT family N-acetyltransferase n=1 Tax=Longispora albida TaxID=203523 RepID=UPI000377D1D4|nr:GNAT family N-acetyltransferase [Longispora albida]